MFSGQGHGLNLELFPVVPTESQRSWKIRWVGTKPVTDTGLKPEIMKLLNYKSPGFGVTGMGTVILQAGASRGSPCSSSFKAGSVLKCLEKLNPFVISGMIPVCLKALTPFNLCFPWNPQAPAVGPVDLNTSSAGGPSHSLPAGPTPKHLPKVLCHFCSAGNNAHPTTLPHSSFTGSQLLQQL